MTNAPIVDISALLPQSGAVQAPQTAGGEAKPKVKSKLWINVGKAKMVQNPATGEMEERIVSTPFGLAIDTMNAKDVPPIRANSPASKLFHDQIVAGNTLLEKLKQKGFALQPGESTILSRDPATGWVIQLQRINENAEGATEMQDGNAFADMFSDL